MSEQKKFSFGKIIAAIVVMWIVYIAATEFVSDMRQFFNSPASQQEVSVIVDQQGTALSDEIRGGRVTYINDDGFGIRTGSDKDVNVKYDKKKKLISLEEKIQMPDIVNATFLYLDGSEEKVTNPQAVKTVKINFTVMTNPMSGIIEKRSIEVPVNTPAH